MLSTRCLRRGKTRAIDPNATRAVLRDFAQRCARKTRFFNDCYIRLAANKYSTDDISDTCTHLTNNSIVCHHENFDKDDPYWMCMWDLDTFKAFLRKKYGPGTDKWAEKVLPAMKHAVVATLSCVAEKLAESDSSGKSFELLGFDFMIDTDLKVWLLEVNTAPCMQPSTPITARLVGPALDDCVRLMLQKADGRDPEEADAEALLLIIFIIIIIIIIIIIYEYSY